MLIFIIIILFYKKKLMDNDCLVVIYEITFSNQNYLTRKFQKWMTS